MNRLDDGRALGARRGLRLSHVALLSLLGSACLAQPDDESVVLRAPEALFGTGAPAPVDDQGELRLYVKQCEAVLGPIPDISCDAASPAPGTQVRRIPVLVDGRLLGFGERAEDAALLAERARTGEYRCDFSSKGGDFPCSVGSTLIQYRSADNPNVQWVGLCRGANKDVPSYDRFIGNGLIGANELTGEMCFFFGANPTPDAPYVLPSLSKTAREGGDFGPWLPPKEMPGSCLSCHPNNDPWVNTPWIQPEYMRATLTSPTYPLSLPPGVTVDDLLAGTIIDETPRALKVLLPEPLPAGRTGWREDEIIQGGHVVRRQYRAVGASYVSNESQGAVKPRTGSKPQSWFIPFRERLLLVPHEESCASGCHALANEHIQKLSHDSLDRGRAAGYMTPTGLAETTWMPPRGISMPHAPQMVEAERPSVSAITECPIPKPLEAAQRVQRAGYVELTWTYANDYGGVPGRDDIRFDVAFSAAATSGHLGVSDTWDGEGVRMEATRDVEVLRDVRPGEDGATYVVRLPSDVVSVEIQPKRYCFEEPDRRPFTYAPPLSLSL